MFKDSFKYYKRRQPPPNFDEVVDFRKKDSFENKVGLVEPNRLDNMFPSLLKPVSEWNIFQLIDRPGLFLVVNPWTELGVKYWVSCCLSRMTEKPNKLNIDDESELGPGESWWETAQQKLTCDRGALLRKLRWATLGYHHNWDTKEYSEENKSDFPADLKAVCSYIADVVGGWSDFNAQAAICNFYHSDSTLSGHRDRSELDMDAPLLSFSFGQSAIFLLGGEDLGEKPTAMFIDNGDIMIMSGASRLSYHGVPRIVMSRFHDVTFFSHDVTTSNCDVTKSRNDVMRSSHNVITSCHDDITTTQTTAYHCKARSCKTLPNEQTDQTKVQLTCYEELFDSTLLSNLLESEFWKPFDEYIRVSRINLNVRQVLSSNEHSIRR